MLSRSASIAASLAACIALDQLTKGFAIRWLRGEPAQSFLGNLFRLEYSENAGAFLSLGARLPESLRFWLLTVLVFLFLLGCLAYLFLDRKMERLMTIGLTLIAGGGISNLLDRMFRTEGRVVDFMNLGIGSLRTGIFNVADIAIMAGVALLAWQSFRAPAATSAASVKSAR